MTLPPGTRLGPYAISGCLGAGGMGEVYRAHDDRLGRDVAVKVLPQHLSSNPKARARFDREAKAISSLNHPHICTLFDVGHEGDISYLVMELVEGETLANRLARGAFPLEQVIRLGGQICNALDRAHRAGVIHRDLKPLNIMLTRNGAKLMDFGLARLTGFAGPDAMDAATARMSRSPTAEQPLTAEGTIAGTLQYMAPEQLEGREPDTRADIWALGCVLYEMACGKRAFAGPSQASLISSILGAEPEPISTAVPTCPQALDHVVRACLAKDPDDRIQSAHDVMLQLEWIRETGSGTAVTSCAAAERGNRERVGWMLAVLGTAAVLGALWLGDRTERPPLARFEIAVPPGEGEVRSLRISPDGRFIAFCLEKNEVQSLWLRALDDLEARSLPGTEGVWECFWSPDSRYIGFFADGHLRRLQVGGGPRQTVCAATGSAGTWSAEGVVLFDNGWLAAPISRVAAEGGTVSSVVPLDSSVVTFVWPEFLPDGRHFLFLSHSAGHSLHWGDIDTGETQCIGPIGSRVTYLDPGYLLHVVGHTLVAQPFDVERREFSGEPIPLADNIRVDPLGAAYFSVSRAGTLVYEPLGPVQERLVVTDRDGRILEEFGEPADYDEVAFSPDGERVAALRTDPMREAHDIWILDPGRGTEGRLTSGPGWKFSPLWSPDGRQLLYLRQESGTFQLRRRAANATGDEDTLAELGSEVFPYSWTPDGMILAEMRRGDDRDIVLIDLADPTPVDLVATKFYEIFPDISPDGRWLLYTSDETGTRELYMRSQPDGGENWQLSTTGGRQPFWREDGREIFYLSDDRHLMSISVDTSGGIHTSSAVPLFEVPWADGGYRDYDVSADGQRFVFVRNVATTEQPPLVVVMNWREALKGR